MKSPPRVFGASSSLAPSGHLDCVYHNGKKFFSGGARESGKFYIGKGGEDIPRSPTATSAGAIELKKVSS